MRIYQPDLLFFSTLRFHFCLFEMGVIFFNILWPTLFSVFLNDSIATFFQSTFFLKKCAREK